MHTLSLMTHSLVNPVVIASPKVFPIICHSSQGRPVTPHLLLPTKCDLARARAQCCAGVTKLHPSSCMPGVTQPRRAAGVAAPPQTPSRGGPPPSPQVPPRQLNRGSTEGLARLCWQWFTYFFSHSADMRNWENEYEEHQMTMASPLSRATLPCQNGQLGTGPCHTAAAVLQFALSPAQPRREFGLKMVYIKITSHAGSFRQEFLHWREREMGGSTQPAPGMSARRCKRLKARP